MIGWEARGGAQEEERPCPPTPLYGDRRYGAEDPEGHHWYFGQHVRDVALEDMKLPT